MCIHLYIHKCIYDYMYTICICVFMCLCIYTQEATDLFVVASLLLAVAADADVEVFNDTSLAYLIEIGVVGGGHSKVSNRRRQSETEVVYRPNVSRFEMDRAKTNQRRSHGIGF